MRTSRQYDNLNRLTSVASRDAAQNVLVSYGYGYNQGNQRTYATNADGTYWAYGYDSFGQVTSAKKHWADGALVAGQQNEFDYDSIGNRTATRSGGDAGGGNLRGALYEANTLNQNTRRTVPGRADIFGTADASATVTVNLQPTYRRGDYFRAELNAPNTASAVYRNRVANAV